MTARQDAQEAAIQAVLEAQSRLHASMLAQERESETRKARLEVLERFTSEHLNDAMLRVPAETQNLNQRLMSLEELNSKSQLDTRTLASMRDNHQDWQSQVEEKLSDLTADQQSRDQKLKELLNAQSTETHSQNDRLEDKLRRLERQVEEQRRQILHLGAIPRMTKQELDTPDKDLQRKLFQDPLSLIVRMTLLGILQAPVRASDLILHNLIQRMTKEEVTAWHHMKR